MSPGIKGWKRENSTITPIDSLEKCLLPVLEILSSAGLEVLFQSGEHSGHPHNYNSIGLEAQILHGHFWFLMPFRQWSKKWTIVLGWVIDPVYQGEIGWIFHKGGKKDCVWGTLDLLGCLLLPCPVIKINRKLQQPNLGMKSHQEWKYGSLLQEKTQHLLK